MYNRHTLPYRVLIFQKLHVTVSYLCLNPCMLYRFSLSIKSPCYCIFTFENFTLPLVERERGFHCPLQSLVGARCCLVSTHQSPTLDLAFPLPAYALHLDTPDHNEANY